MSALGWVDNPVVLKNERGSSGEVKLGGSL